MKHSDSNEHWSIDFPNSYFEDRADYGLHLSHREDAPDCHVFSDWLDYENDQCRDKGIIHTELKLVSSQGQKRNIQIPRGQGRFYCFRNFEPEISIYPSIFRAKRKLVTYCSCTCSWEGLLNSSILTVDIEKGMVLNQYWEKDWLETFIKSVPEAASDAGGWSNGSLQIYLNTSEDMLLIHSDYHEKHEASMIFKWARRRWELVDVVPGTFLQFSSQSSAALREVLIGPNSLTRE